jgi:serine peptidase DegS
MTSAWKVAAFFAQSAAVGLALAFIVVLAKPDLINAGSNASASSATSYASAVAASAPAVANIYTERNLYTERSLSFSGGRNAAPGGVLVRGQALGSGVVIDKQGYLVTNWHVIKDADQIRVQLADGRIAIPQLVGADPETELALLRIDLPDLPQIKLGRSDSLEVGEVVLAIGNSLGLSQTVTMGIVSATGRGQLGVTIFENFIQTDAAINVGNSGGALVNARGELIGINTAVISAAAKDLPMPEGLGFAIPVNLVRGVMDQLIAHGRVIRGYLGVDTVDLPAQQARAFGVTGSAVLLQVVRGPAAAAGLLPGDVLTHINDQRMYTQTQAMNLVASSQPGERIRIRVARPNGTVFATEAVLEERRLQEGG